MESESKSLLPVATNKHGLNTTLSAPAKGSGRIKPASELTNMHIKKDSCESAILRPLVYHQFTQPIHDRSRERAGREGRPAMYKRATNYKSSPSGMRARLITVTLAILVACGLSSLHLTQATGSPGEPPSSANSPSIPPSSAPSSSPAASSSSSVAGAPSSSNQAASSPVAQIATSALLSAIDSAVTGKESTGGQSQKSIVASLSSAVASAAAAAAVAAAQNSLSGGDGRSLLGTNPRANSGQPRSPGLNLALKLADSIPEVPYNILHNMKKVDHAAPFYNVPNRMSGATKESSSHSLLASALAASGGFDQLATLLKSPVWKRIADGYGEFTSEFRSLFRAPATPMKGSTGTTSRLLRELSVPALLMLVASTIPSEWRPVRTRRKSQTPNTGEPIKGLPIGFDQMAAAASNSDVPNFSMSPAEFIPQAYASQVGQATPRVAPHGAAHSAAMYPQQSDMIQSGQFVGAGDQVVANELPARANSDINLQAASEASWQQLQSAATSLAPLHQIASSQQQQQQQQQEEYFGAHLAQQNQASSLTGSSSNLQPQQQQPMVRRRFGDTLTLDAKPVKREQAQLADKKHPLGSNQNSASLSPASGLFGSLTSTPRVGQASERAANSPAALIMNKIMNANRELVQLARQPTGLLGALGLSSKARKDHLGDQHKYSLVGLDTDGEPLAFGGFGAPSQAAGSQHAGDHTQRSPDGRAPFSLASLTRALGLSGVTTNGVQVKSGLVDGQDHHHDHQASSAINRRQAQQAEQRDLTLLLPSAWREAVKRTMSSVQQQASTQWRSIEGQLTNWVQDKLKAVPASGAATGGSSSPASGSSPTASSNAPVQVANLIASVSSTAMNMLGLGGKSGQTSGANQQSSSTSSPTADLQTSTASSQERSNKLESPAKTSGRPASQELSSGR